MTFRLTVLTPTLVGDGNRLAPIDYMVWKDQINVLDQHRIFRLLSKGSRLEGYLTQLRRADRLDFASWGGFAQNYAARRVPFEHATSTAYWNGAHTEDLFIPTFASGPRGPYLPASALKGALRTGFAFSRWNAGVIREVGARITPDRIPRRLGEAAESMTLGGSGADPMRGISAADSDPVGNSSFRVYLVRVSTVDARNSGRYELGRKQAPRGTVARPEQSTPIFAEMAVPGTVFSGGLKTTDAPHRRGGVSAERLLQAANDHASQLIGAHRKYAELTGLQQVVSSLDALNGKVEDVRRRQDACVINIGWGAGFLGKTAFIDTENEDYRSLLRKLPFYERAIRSGLPFPKTRRIVFEGNQPSTLPGWAMLEVA